MKILLAALTLLLFAGIARADSIWNYSGNVMQPCGCSLSGTVTLDANNLAVAWDFTDGTDTFTPSNSVAHIWASFRYDIWNPPPGFAGTPWQSWLVDIADFNHDFGIHTEFDPNGPLPGSGGIGSDTNGLWAFDTASTSTGLYGFEEGNRGTWTAVATPEPGTLALIGVGLAGLLARRRLQARRNQVPEAVWEPLS